MPVSKRSTRNMRISTLCAQKNTVSPDRKQAAGAYQCNPIFNPGAQRAWLLWNCDPLADPIELNIYVSSGSNR
jgi:hypothetical protein